MTFLEGAAWFLMVHQGQYNWQKLVTQLKKEGPDGIADMSRGAKRLMGGASWLNHYRAIVEAYNKSIRKAEDKLEAKTSRWSAETAGQTALRQSSQTLRRAA